MQSSVCQSNVSERWFSEWLSNSGAWWVYLWSVIIFQIVFLEKWPNDDFWRCIITLYYYELQSEAWEELTELPANKHGTYIALNIPDSDDTKIKEKVFESLKLDSLKQADGLKKLINFMDKHL